nr:type II 3-dehydroquinate dehydratase [Berryella wangjianweii]
MGNSLRILVLNGPNMNMLGVREPAVYGTGTLADLERFVRTAAQGRGVEVSFFQSNSEGALVDAVQQALGRFDGLVINPAALTHYSIAVRDALAAVGLPAVEVHLSDIDAREPFRRMSVVREVCIAQVSGRGFAGYAEALALLQAHLQGGERQADARGQHIADQGAIGPADVPLLDASALRRRIMDDAPSGEHPFFRRRAALRAAMDAAGIDALLLRETSDIRWLCAFDDVFDDERAHALLVRADRVALHTDSRYSQAVREAAARVGNAVEVSDERMSVSAWVAREAAGAAALGIEDVLPLREYRALAAALPDGGAVSDAVSPRLVETSGMAIGLRSVKDRSELVRLRAAQAVTDAAFAHIVRFMRPGLTERAVQVELEHFMRCHGGEGLAFSSIVATGPNGASPHAIPGDARLEAGQCVVLDFGARALGYCSDMTRMVFLGQPSDSMRRAYAALRRANETVERRLRVGMTGAEAYELAEGILAEEGFAGRMGHGLGHGVGIDIHEEPVLSPRNRSPLAAGSVVTVEPGIYLPGEFGMRLEDTGVLTDDGYEVFGCSPHEMVII